MIIYREPFTAAAARPPRVARAWEAQREGEAASFAELMARDDGLMRLEKRDAHRAEPAVQAYLRMDEFLGRLRARYDADFVVVSDHGWSFDGHLHYGSPDGVLILSGPSFRAGTNLREAGIEDIAPTVLTVLGLPLSEERAGDVLAAAFAGEPVVSTVPTYGEPVRASPGAEQGGEQQVERLRALGYVQ
jgi:hypothetical protein